MSPDDETTEVSPRCPGCGRRLPRPGAPCSDCTETDAGCCAPGREAGFTGPRRIAGYRVLRELGAGGMGTVFEAFQESMQRKVALKVLSRHHAPSTKADRRFEQEAWIGGRLDHPNLVKVYERGEWEELSFYSMELVEGGSLFDVIGNMRRWGRDDRLGLEFGGRRYVEWAIQRVIEAARGLEYAHRRGVVHRDIKPMNLLLGGEQRAVKIADFGLAIEEDATRLTTAGKILGTLVYMAPEQFLGRQREIGPATDVYALGVTLFELLTLEYPYVGETQQLYMNAVLTSAARRPSKLNERVSRDLEVVIGKALEKNPRDRYASAAEFADDLENVLHFRPIRARPPAWAQRVAKWARRKPVHAALLATLLVVGPSMVVLIQRAVEHRQLVRQTRIEQLRREMRLLDRRDHRAFVEASTEILRLAPDDVIALRDRAVNSVYLAQEIEGRAATAAQRAESGVLIASGLESMSRLAALQPEVAAIHLLHAHLLDRLGRKEEAEEARRLAERYRSEEPGDDELELDAMLAANRGEHERAVELFSELIARRPTRTGPILGRASSYEKLAETDRAERDYARVVAIDADDPVARLNLGRLLIRRGESEEGRGHIAVAARLLPENAIVLQAMADALLEQGRQLMYDGETERALEEFRRAEKAARRSLLLDPEQPLTRVNLGASLAEQYRLAEEPDARLMTEAIEQYECEIALWRDLEGRPGAYRDPEAYEKAVVNLCDSSLQVGNLARGLEICLEATRLTPRDPIAFYNLAGAYALAGRPDAAFAALERDLALGDTDHEYLARDPWFESIRDDPRFADLLARMRRAATAQP